VELEADVRKQCEAGDIHAATTAAIQGYGPEVLGLLVVLVGRNEAPEVFADVCVRIWKGLPSFRWESSLRTWIYVLARRASAGYRKELAQRGQRQVPLSQVPEIDEMIVRVRTTLINKLGTQGEKTRAERLREQLTDDEQILLTLRLDRGLEWNEIVSVLHEESDGEVDVTREAAALRKRFERIKEKLKKLAAA
jgi:RNA polymerase sigma-70 factor (ECF subfamily)